MGDERKAAPETDSQKIVRLEKSLTDAWFQIQHMQKMGGFTDAKTHSVRATRIEDRVERLELDGEMLKDVSAFHNGFIEQHLKDRHDVAGIDRDDAPDVVPWRRARQALRRWVEKRGLMDKRRDVTRERSSENRLRPQAAR